MHAMCAPGWHTEVLDGRYVARRLSRLSDYQLSNGCMEEMTALGPGELWLLTDAQGRLAERVAVAEATRARAGAGVTGRTASRGRFEEPGGVGR